LIEYSARAVRQIEELRHHYEDRERIEAILALDAALDEAERKIESNPAAGLSAPRPYPHLARRGRAWVKAGRYWVAYTATQPPVITAVFYDTANIPGRVYPQGRREG
jgi:plasmid stabilization system protein ParE